MPTERPKKEPKPKAEQVRFTQGQLDAIDRLVANQRYGDNRTEVIRFFVMQGLAEFDKRGQFPEKPSNAKG